MKVHYYIVGTGTAACVMLSRKHVLNVTGNRSEVTCKKCLHFLNPTVGPTRA